jgi:putative Mn2+ efflux pump MntP
VIHHLIVNGFLFLALGLDTFAVAVGLGISGLDRREQLRFGLSFALAEGLMPLAGFGLGQVVAQAAGEIASYAAILLLLAVGVYAIREAFQEEEREFDGATPWKLIVLAISVSLDELAVGFSLGLLHVPVLLAVLYIAAQAFVVTLIGTALGKRVGEILAERAELVSGLALVGLAFFLLGEKLLGG